MKKPATSDSSVYRATFYGILNAQGDFWTPLAFESEGGAKKHLANFIALNPHKFLSMERTHKIVPVRIQLTELRDRDGAEGGDANAAPVPQDRQERLKEALDDAIATLAAVRAASTSEEWAESADHFRDLCLETIKRSNVALASLPPAASEDVEQLKEEVEQLKRADHRAVMANVRLGAWMSAALDDPTVCDAMKADIHEWFSSGHPPHSASEVKASSLVTEDMVKQGARALVPVLHGSREDEFGGDLPDMQFDDLTPDWQERHCEYARVTIEAALSTSSLVTDKVEPGEWR